MRPSSSPSEDRDVVSAADTSDPFAVVFGDPVVDAACGAGAWLTAMLNAERALAETLAGADLIPAEAAQAIGSACRGDHVTTAVFGEASSASPVIPLVRALTDAVPPSARAWVHYGATSQDIMDSAMMLVSRRCTVFIAGYLDAAADHATSLVERHRETLLIGRTLGRHAAPTTFGALAAGWLSGLDAARKQLRQARAELAAQLGGPVGTLEGYGAQGLRILADFADRLGLADPGLPWHTERVRVARLGSTLAIVAGAVAKIARDVTVLGSSDVAELREGGAGTSSAMPHKRNPGDSLLVLANARAAPGHAATLLAAVESELQRPAGAWQSEWQALSQLLRRTGGATAFTVPLLANLRVDAERMRSNLDSTGGLLRAGTVADGLAPALGRLEAHEHVAKLATRAASGPEPFGGEPRDRPGTARAGLDGRPDPGGEASDPPGTTLDGKPDPRINETRDHPGPGRLAFRELLGTDPTVTAHLTKAQLDELCDPAACLPAARAIADRALARHRATEES